MAEKKKGIVEQVGEFVEGVIREVSSEIDRTNQQDPFTGADGKSLQDAAFEENQRKGGRRPDENPFG